MHALWAKGLSWRMAFAVRPDALTEYLVAAGLSLKTSIWDVDETVPWDAGKLF
jgi:hypothetical protein